MNTGPYEFHTGTIDDCYDWRMYLVPRWFIFTLFAIICLVAIALGFTYQQSGSALNGVASTSTNQYANTTYGYTLQYPQNYQVQETVPEFVAVVSQDANPLAKADVAVLSAAQTDPFRDFNSFAMFTAELACKSVTPTGATDCPSVASNDAYTSPTGLTGKKIYLNTFVNGSRSATKRGPYYLLDISKNTPDRKFTALIIYPPTALSNNEIDEAFLQGIVDSVQLQKPTAYR